MCAFSYIYSKFILSSRAFRKALYKINNTWCLCVCVLLIDGFHKVSQYFVFQTLSSAAIDSYTQNITSTTVHFYIHTASITRIPTKILGHTWVYLLKTKKNGATPADRQTFQNGRIFHHAADTRARIYIYIVYIHRFNELAESARAVVRNFISRHAPSH